jgi:hypothetical protein
MALRKELVQQGESFSGALAAAGTCDIGVTVNKSVMVSQATAYVIKACNTVVTTSDTTPTSGQNALVLPAAVDQGDWLQVANFTANVIYVWPPVGWGIHGLGQNTTYSLAAGKTANFSVVTDPNKPFNQGNGAFTFNQYLAIQG